MTDYRHKGQILPLVNQMIPIDKETTFHASYDYGLHGFNQGEKVAPYGDTGSIEFDGVNDYIDFGNIGFSELSNCTVEFWAKVSSTANWLFIRGGTNSKYILADTNTGDFYHNTAGSPTIYIDGEPGLSLVRDGKWHHYAVVGVNMSSWTEMTMSNYSSWMIHGAIQDFRIWSQPQSQSSIKNRMNQRLKGNETGLYGFWPLNEKEGPISFDQSEKQNDGQWYGGITPTWGRTIAFKAEGKFRNGVLIEPDTINIAKNTDYANRTYGQVYDIGGWGGDDADVIYYAGGGYNGLPYKRMIKHTGGTGGSYINEHALFPIKDNTTYIISCYMKASRNVTVNGYALDINRPSDNAYRTGGNIGLTTEWKRHSWVYTSGTGHAGDYHSRQIIYIDDVLPTEIYWCGFQVEEKPIATSYVNGSRPEGRLEYPAAPLVNPTEGTISMWVKPRHSSLNPYCNIFSILEIGNENTNRLSVERSNTSNNYCIVTGIGYSDYVASGSFAITPDVWSHLTVTWASSVFNVYLNGINVLSWTTTKMPATFAKSVLDIGCGMNWKNRNIDGAIDEVRIERRAISAEEAAAWHTSGLHYNFLDYSYYVD